MKFRFAKNCLNVFFQTSSDKHVQLEAVDCLIIHLNPAFLCKEDRDATKKNYSNTDSSEKQN